MKILHTISSLGVNSGGPPLSTTLAIKGVRNKGVDVDILTYDVSSENDKNISNENYIHYLPPPFEKKFGYSKLFRNYLESHDCDLYHCQGVWQYPTYITAKKARKFKKPYVITPRGMLYPQQLKPSELHKKLAMALYLKRDLQEASCIHATCEEEMKHLRDLGITVPIAVIPNPIETDGFLNQPVNRPDKRRFGYLGRIHPRKNVERIFYAWEQLGDHVKESELIIIGDGDENYLQFLKGEVERLQLTNVEFTGFLSGQEKERKLASLSYLVVPSDFENFGMIIAEALVRGIPVIASKGTPWRDLETYKCGWWIENNVKKLAKAMEIAINLKENKRIKRGYNGKALIKKKYSIECVGEDLKELYTWLVSKKSEPEFIYL